MACPLEDVASSNGGGNINSSSYIIIYIYIFECWFGRVPDYADGR